MTVTLGAPVARSVRARSHQRETQLRPLIKLAGGAGADVAFRADLRQEAVQAQRHGWQRLPLGCWLVLRRLGPWVRMLCVVLVAFVGAMLFNLGGSPSGQSSAVGSSAIARADITDMCGLAKPLCSVLLDKILAPIHDVINVADAAHDWIYNLITPNTWCDRTQDSVDDPTGGFSNFFLRNSTGDTTNIANGKESGGVVPYNNQVGTLWGSYGAAGTDWQSYFLDCLSFSHVTDSAAGMIFAFSKVISLTTILTFQQTFSGSLLNVFIGDGNSILNQVVSDLHTKIYIPYIALAIVIGGVVLAWRGLIKGTGLADVLSKFFIMVAVSGTAAYYFADPATILKSFNDNTNQVTQIVMKALISQDDCLSPSYDDVSNKNKDYPTTASPSGKDGKPANPIDCVSDGLYRDWIFIPWATGAIGSLRDSDNTDPRHLDKYEGIAYKLLWSQAFTWSEAAKSEGERNSLKQDKEYWRTNFLVKNNWQAKLVERDDNGKETGRHELDPTGKDKSAQFDDVQTNDMARWQLFAGDKPGERFKVALLALLASLIFGVLFQIIAISYLVLELVTVIMAMTAPIFFLLGLVPVVGLKILLRWLEIFLGAFVKRVVMACFIGILLAFYRVIEGLQGVPWWLQMLLVVALLLGGIAYRKRFTQLGNINLSQSGDGGGAAAATQRWGSTKGAWRETRGTGMSLAERLAYARQAGTSAPVADTGMGGGSHDRELANRIDQLERDQKGQRGETHKTEGDAQRTRSITRRDPGQKPPQQSQHMPPMPMPGRGGRQTPYQPESGTDRGQGGQPGPRKSSPGGNGGSSPEGGNDRGVNRGGGAPPSSPPPQPPSPPSGGGGNSPPSPPQGMGGSGR